MLNPSSPPESEPPAMPVRDMPCPNCGVRLSVEMPEAEVIIVCPKCFMEFTPPLHQEEAPPTVKPVKQSPRRRGALKRGASAEAGTVPRRVRAAEIDPLGPKPKDRDRATHRPAHMPMPELIDPVIVHAGVTLEQHNRREASSGLLKIVVLALILIGGSVLVWVLLYNAQMKDLKPSSSSASTSARPGPAVTSNDDVPEATVKTRETAPKTKEAPQPGPPAPSEAPKLKPDQEEALRAAEAAAAALAAPTWQELLAHVRAPAAVKSLMRGYYASAGPFRPERATGIISANLGVSEEGRHLAYVSLQMQDYREQRVLLERNGNGVFLVDWESLVGYQPVSWDQFIRTKPRTATEFRVGVELLQEAPSQVHSLPGVIEPLDNYFPFGLKPGHEGEPTLAYMKNTAPGVTDFYARLQTGQRFDAILKLRFTDIEGAGEVIEITELVQYGWMKGYGAAAPDGSPVKIEKQPF